MLNLVSVSSAPIARLGNFEYYDLDGTLEVMRRVFSEGVVDGFELQVEPEWDEENPPLTDVESADWTKTPKFTITDVVDQVRKSGVKILSVHASRDIGSYLCSDRSGYVKKGKRLILESLRIARELMSDICVFHLWDTWKERFDIDSLRQILSESANRYPEIKASVENIPTTLKGRTPFQITKLFRHITLDLRWAALYDELDRFESIRERIANVHLRGRLEDQKWILAKAPFDFYDALKKIKVKWRYSGPLTVEPEGGMTKLHFADFLQAMRTIRKD